ncbi:MAG: hypothetical protein JOZ46_06570, partial [Candidatus Dormibacteraeota bacterium]|nr:hypothetical protein [Candidatus Dormibacteraeota bacterium]
MLAACVVAGAALGVRTLLSQPPPRMVGGVTSGSGTSAEFRADGGYSVVFASPRFTFAGTLGAPPTSVTTSNGTDEIGAYSAVTAAYTNANVRREATVRVYDSSGLARFITRYLDASPNTAPFPSFTSTPALPYTFGYRDSAFALPSFTDPGVQGPFTAFDGAGNTYVMSPGANFMVAAQTRASGVLSGAIDAAIPSLPAGFSHATLLAAGHGINATLDTWGAALRAVNARTAVDTTSVVLQRVGYWTDNGATYYYRHAPGQTYEQTLVAMRDEFTAKSVPLGYVQLDSWWYRKDSKDHGIYLYEADPGYLPDGITGVGHALGLPLVTHARWLAPNSPYRAQYAVSDNVPISAAYYRDVLRSTSAGGTVMYEQDWLEQNAAPRETLSDAPALLTAINQGAADAKQTVQLCMATPRYFLEASRWPAITNIRVSTDRFERSRWDAFLYTSELAREAGLLPWSDVFMSSETDNLLLSTLSAGPVGVGDAEGQVDAANLLQSVRADGVIVKPDSPLVPLDSSYIADAQAAAAHSAPAPMVAATRTDHGGGMVAAYVVAYARGGSTGYSFSPADVGVHGDAYVYDYFTHTGRVVPAGQTYTGATHGGVSYDIVVPVGPSGIALIGDGQQLVTLGAERVASLADNGAVRAAVSFAPSEHSATMSGWSPSPPHAAVNDTQVPVAWSAA